MGWGRCRIRIRKGINPGPRHLEGPRPLPDSCRQTFPEVGHICKPAIIIILILLSVGVIGVMRN